MVIEHGDWSVVEHCSATVRFRVDRGITHEVVRSRLNSYTQESTRFVNGKKKYPEGLEFIRPKELSTDSMVNFNWMQALIAAEQSYFAMLDLGVRPQEARSVLPNALASTIIVTGNFRNWRCFFLSRTTRETHPDFKAMVIPLLAEFKKRIPILFDDIEPEARQIENMRKPR